MATALLTQRKQVSFRLQLRFDANLHLPLNQRVSQSRVIRIWNQWDIAYLWTKEGWLYLTIVPAHDLCAFSVRSRCFGPIKLRVAVIPVRADIHGIQCLSAVAD